MTQDNLVLSAVDQCLLDQYTSKLGSRDGSFHISELGLCLKGAYYRRLGAKEPYSADKQRIFEIGNIMEEKLITFLFRNGYSVIEQLEVNYPELDLAGHCDCITVKNGKLRLLEIKTMNSNGFRVMKEKLMPAKPHHQIQLALYWNKLREKYPGLEASVVYINKDTMDIYETLLTTEELENGVRMGLERAAVLHNAWVAKTPPTNEEEGWVANYCGLHTYCMGLQTL